MLEGGLREYNLEVDFFFKKLYKILIKKIFIKEITGY